MLWKFSCIVTFELIKISWSLYSHLLHLLYAWCHIICAKLNERCFSSGTFCALVDSKEITYMDTKIWQMQIWILNHLLHTAWCDSYWCTDFIILAKLEVSWCSGLSCHHSVCSGYGWMCILKINMLIEGYIDFFSFTWRS